jgi:adenylate cyclase
VNLTFRLEGLTKELHRSIVTSQAFAQTCPTKLRSLGYHAIRGLADPQEVFGLMEHESATAP